MTLSRRIASATLQLTLSNALVRLLSIFTMPILTRLLAPSAYGTAAMAGTMISLVSVFALAGMDMSYMRAYPSKISPSGQAVEIFAWRYVLVSGICAGLALYAAWQPIAVKFSLPDYLGGLLGIGIVLSLANTMSQTRARLNNRYRAMSVSIIVAGLTAVSVSIGVACWWRQDEMPLILSMIIGYLVPVLILGPPAISRLCKPSGMNPSERRSVFSIGIAGTLTAPAYWILSSLDRWFLGYYEDTASAGIYSLGYSVAIMGIMANNAVISVWTPEAAREYENNPEKAQIHLGRLAERLMTGFACIWLAITASGGDMIRLLAAPAFHDAAPLVPFIAAGVFFHGIIHLENAGLLIVKKLNYSIWCWLGGGWFCVMSNFILVPLFGRLGAAVTQTASFALMAIGITAAAQWLYPLQISWRKMGMVLSGILVLAVLMHPAWADHPGKSLILKFPVGFLAVLGILKWVAPEVLSWANRFFLLRKQQG